MLADSSIIWTGGRQLKPSPARECERVHRSGRSTAWFDPTSPERPSSDRSCRKTSFGSRSLRSRRRLDWPCSWETQLNRPGVHELGRRSAEQAKLRISTTARRMTWIAKLLGKKIMTSLHQAWATLQPRLKILEPVQFSSDHWSLIERMHANFNDREAHTHLPIPIARFREAARKAIYEHAKQFDDVKTEYVNDSWFAEKFVNGTARHNGELCAPL